MKSIRESRMDVNMLLFFNDIDLSIIINTILWIVIKIHMSKTN